MVKHQTQSDSARIYKAVYTIVREYGLQDEAVQTAITYFRNKGYGSEVECAIFEVENELFMAADEY